MIIEQTNGPLLKNHDLRTTSLTVVLEAHTSFNKSFGHFKGHGRRQGHDFWMGGGRSGPSNQNNPDNKETTL